jgi:hypothetical protein
MVRRTSSIGGALLIGAMTAVASPAAAQSGVVERLQIHGFLTQAAVQSSDLPIYGIRADERTLDYRNAALQFRYALSDNDNVVMQLGHRRLGHSMITAQHEDLQLKYAFYQRRLGDFSVRAGRVPLPGGIFNETRNVGTLLPFYRAPASYYMEGIETIDGLVASHYLSLGEWSVESAVSGGGMDIVVPLYSPEGGFLLEQRLENVFGGELWLNTALTGVRVGGFAQRWDTADMPALEEWLWSISAEGERGRTTLRGEYREMTIGEMEMTSYYAHASVRVIGGLHANGQLERQESHIGTPFGTMSYTGTRDAALGLRYVLSPNVVFKFEGHDMKGSAFDAFVNPMQPAKTKYYISSVSVSF